MKLKLSKFGDYERLTVLPMWSNFNFYIVFTDDFKRSYERRFGPTTIDFFKTGAFHKFTKTGAGHVFFKIGDCRTGTIAHECYHAVMSMLERWADVKELDEELVAYHLDYFTQLVADFRNLLIDANLLGVKSNAARGSDESNSSAPQGTTVGLQSVQSSNRNATETRTQATQQDGRQSRRSHPATSRV
jgi:hypothetical protein